MLQDTGTINDKMNATIWIKAIQDHYNQHPTRSLTRIHY
jgi:hypothetical protein